MVWPLCVGKASGAIRSRVRCSSAPATAPVSGQERRQFRITHPFHPSYGRTFEVAEHRWVYTQSILFFEDQWGSLQQIPAVWTDFLKEDPFCEIAAGRSPLHGGCLVPLAEMLQSWLRQAAAVCKENSAAYVNIITPITPRGATAPSGDKNAQ